VSLPHHDTTRFLDEFRTAQISHLLTAAVARFDVGAALCDQPLRFDELTRQLNLAERSAIVLLTGLRSIELIDVLEDGRIGLTDYGREKLSPKSACHLRGYIGLGAFSADVQNMIACLENNAPAGDVSFVYHEEGPPSALDEPATADLLSRAMADRARNVAPFVAKNLDLGSARCLLDVGGGHGIYSMELLKKNPELRAIVVDREPAMVAAKEFAEVANLNDRIDFVHGDIFQFESSDVDVILMANILHDYDTNDAASLVQRFAKQLNPGGRLMILDAFLDSVDSGMPPVSTGPREVAAYSALLFSICEGRCYRFDEAQSWLEEAGLKFDPERVFVPAHGSVLSGWAQ